MYTTWPFLSALNTGGVGTGASEERERDREKMCLNILSPSNNLLLNRNMLANPAAL